MKDVLMFILPGCPHCRYALGAQQALLEGPSGVAGDSAADCG